MEITFDSQKCRHNGQCVKTLPEVFKVEKSQLIIIQNGASEDAIQKTVNACPSGALAIKK
ncbi:(4Fe-4S)-binding protein [Aliikangiella sp. IMCC44359]|uniref:(4Fe-4S)-binding protein n=1 Tax=Aliikangiella sp. IMCC44359 TaxID=3459125 RepID=UPI00403AD287